MAEKEIAAVQEFLKLLEVGKKQYKDGLSIFPLHGATGSTYDYVILDEAIRQKVLIVTEIGSGTVPEISVLNKANKDVFIMDGQELIGAKQNRIVNISLVVPAESEIKIPVSCVEQGRWHHTSEHFHESEDISYANLRKTQKASVLRSVAVGGEFRADQGEVWDNIAYKMSVHGVASPTSAMSDIYKEEKTRISGYSDIFKIVKGQLGAVFCIGENIFGMDIFDKEETCNKLMPRIIKSYVMEILYGEKVDKQVKKEDIKQFLARVMESSFSVRKSPGAGMTVSITGKELGGTSLIARDTVIHTAVFNRPEQEHKEEEYSYMRNPVSRRDTNIIR